MSDVGPLVIRMRAEAFDDEDFPLGVIRVASDGSVRSRNRALERMLGDTLKLGMQVTDLPLDAKSRAALDEAIEARFGQQRGTGYHLVVSRRDHGTVVRLRVAAVPEYGANGGLVGSMGFIVDETLDLVATAIYQEMEQASEPTALLRSLAQHVREIIPYDSFMVTAIGADTVHLRSLFETPDPPPLSSPYRWFPMPEFVQTMLRDLKPGPFDLDTLYADPDFAGLCQRNEAARVFRARDFHHSLRLRVRSKGTQVALVTLYRNRGQPAFTDADLATCQRLPVIDAVAWAMALDEQLQHRFAIDLISSLTEAGEHAMEVAQRLVDQLWEHFKWEHVSLFRVVEDRGRVRLVCQAQREARRLRDGFEQSVEKGLLGRCARTGQPVNVGDVEADPEYVVGIDGIKSELVMPLPGAKLRWLLNIESSMRDAFAAEEQHAVEMLLRVTASVLERTALLELRTAIMDNVADAIIQTNERNTIRDVNVACTRLLGRCREQMIGRDLTSFLAVTDAHPSALGSDAPEPWHQAPTDIAEVDEQACSLIQSDVRASEVVRFAKGDGSTISMLVSTATIPGEFGGKVFIASDLSGKQYLDRVERLIPIFRQLASEIRVPLALAGTFLEDSSEEAAFNAASRDLLEKAHRQIRKADLSVEQVMHAASAADGGPLERTSFDLKRLLEQVKGSLPREKSRSLRLTHEASAPVFVSGAYPELLFCVESLVAHLLRLRADGEAIDIDTSIEHAESRALLTLHLEGGSRTGAGLADKARTATEMVMIDAVIPTLMERMAGSYVGPRAGQSGFRLALPLAG